MSSSLTKILRQYNLNVTNTRLKVFESLRSQGPIAMNELVTLCSNNHINRASTYRTIKLFEELGLVRRITLGWKYKVELSDAFTYHHHHISCRSCGTTVDIPASTALESILVEILDKTKFTQVSHELEATGICSACQK